MVRGAQPVAEVNLLVASVSPARERVVRRLIARRAALWGVNAAPAAYNGRVGLAISCPLTNRVKGYPFEVRVPPELPVTGVVLSDQVKSLDWRARDAAYICALPEETTTEVLRKLGTLVATSRP